MIINILEETLNIFLTKFKIAFPFFFVSAALSQLITINVYKYLPADISIESIEQAQLPVGLLLSTLLLMILVIYIYGIVVSYMLDPNSGSRKKDLVVAHIRLKQNLGRFILTFILMTVFFTLLSLALSVVGVLLSIMLLLLILPSILDGQPIIKSINDSAIFAWKNLGGVFFIAIIIVFTLIVQSIVMMLVVNTGSQAAYGIESVLLIFIGASVKPFLLAIAVSAYRYSITKHDMA